MILIILFSFILFCLGIKILLPINDNKPLQWIISGLLSFSLLSHLFISCLFLNPSYFLYIVLLIILCIAAILLIWKKQRKNIKLELKIDKWAIRFLFVILIGTILFTIKSNRWGDWDAWANWHLRAKFLCYDNLWLNLFNYEGTPDYPLMLPSIIAMLWKTIGNFNPIVPVVIAYLIFLSILSVLFFSFSKPNQKIFGLIGIIILVSDIGFITRAASQYADSLLSLFILISTILISNAKEKSSSYFILSGIMVSSVIWIKNEGIVFFIFITALLLYKNLKQKSFKNFLHYIIGLIPITSIFLFFKIYYAPPNELLKQNIHFLGSLFNFEKHLIIAKFFTVTLFKQFPLLLILSLTIVLLSPKKLFSEMPIILSATCLVYLSFYLFIPSEINWQLSTSLDRLIHQLYPSFLYCFLLIIQTHLNNTNQNFKQQNL